MATYEPARVGAVPTHTPLPKYLWPIGTLVVLANGAAGVVEHYEFYHLKQTTFPVKDSGGYTTICSAATVQVASDRLEIDVAATVQQLRVVRKRQTREKLGLPPASSQAS